MWWKSFTKLCEDFTGQRYHDHPPSPCPPPHTHTHTFLRSKKKKGQQREKRKTFKQKLLKGCHQVQNVTVLAIVERLEFKHFSGRPTMVADNTCQCSMAPPLWNSFLRPCMKMINTSYSIYFRNNPFYNWFSKKILNIKSFYKGK